MTTLADARAELVAGMASVGGGATSTPGLMAPPYVLIAGDGADVTHVTLGKFPSTWRIVLIAGGWDGDGTSAALDTMKQAAVAALRGLAKWQMQPLGRDGIRTFAGAELLTAELRGVRMIDV
jgi:hypothetical protein